MLESGKISIHDDREVVPPWGINGGLFGGTSAKWIVRQTTGEKERIPSKIDNLEVEAGDVIIFRTAGSGGWGDPYERPAEEVARDVRYDLVSPEKALEGYGVVLGDDLSLDVAATEKLRAERRAERGEPEPFNFGFTPQSA